MGENTTCRFFRRRIIPLEIPPAVADRRKRSTLACTVRLVRAAAQSGISVVPGNEDLATPDGKWMSKERILARCGSLREPAEYGIEYNIVRWQLLPLCPGLMELLAEADNAKHDTFRKETVCQTMFNIHRRTTSIAPEDTRHKT